ncbi:outer membrane beta-barrel family protein [Flavicella sediminum]|uniref:outer membrane beta-barrel family protein n=1 Tax=Flavicella sediminum TaxID=2585141 RepID=UPI001124A26F|nr:outer membrane beta-barrel family protein [Flavicella sediminum]
MKNTPYFVFFFMLLLNSVNAQKNVIQVKGKVLTAENQAIEFATVALMNSEDKKPILGTVTNEKGIFSIPIKSRDFYVEISFIGFETKTITNFSIANGQVALGNVILNENSESLNEVVVRAEKSQTEFKLDKRVFNVGKDLSSTGVSALEVLNNVPSVNVNIEGAISLRGSTGVQILINGKPSVIASDEGNALGTITAEMIEKVEVITNPSAKYDAEGTTGIINIVLKKEERRGINGSISINTGTPHNHSVGLSVNRRTEKFNLFSQLGMGYREMPSYFDKRNENLVTDTIIRNSGVEYRNEKFYNLILGTDYHINERNVVTLSGSYAYEVEEQPSETNYTKEGVDGGVSDKWTRREVTDADNPKFKYELQYKSDFKDDEKHTLLFSALGSFFGKDQSSDFENITELGSRPDAKQKTFTNYKESSYTFKLDYTKPFSEKVVMETGAQYVMQQVENDYSLSNLENGAYVPDAALTNVFEYKQNVLGVYGTLAYENNKFGVKAGLRLENTDLGTLLVEENKENGRNFTNLFPSMHSSYKFTEVFSVQAGYSKRVYRPRLWDLMPFFNVRNEFSIRQGNPDLLPEFTDSFEISSIFNFNKVSMNFGVYHHNTTDVIDRISLYDEEENITTMIPENIGTRKSTGVEWNTKFSPTQNLTFTGDFNYNYFSRKGSLDAQVFDFSADRWNGKLTTKLKLFLDIDFEITGRYQSGNKTVQGTVSSQAFADMGLRKKIMKGKGVFSLGVRDLFESRISESEVAQEDFYVYSQAYRGRFVTLGFSYGFGKGEAMEYAGKRR